MNPKPKTVAMIGADAEYSKLAFEGARENAKKAGSRSSTIAPIHQRRRLCSIVRPIKAANPDLISWPPTRPTPRDDPSSTNSALPPACSAVARSDCNSPPSREAGPMLNNVVSYDLYVPEPTMNFPGIEQLLTRYRDAGPGCRRRSDRHLHSALRLCGGADPRAGGQGGRPLDDGKLAEYIHKPTSRPLSATSSFSTGANGRSRASAGAISEHRRRRRRAVQAGRQASHYLPARIEIGQRENAVRRYPSLNGCVILPFRHSQCRKGFLLYL